MMNKCRCGHHWMAGLLVLLTWVGAVAYFWAELKGVLVWGHDSTLYFQGAVLLTLLGWGTKVCGCCRRACMGKAEGDTCSHPGGCNCGDCGRCK